MLTQSIKELDLWIQLENDDALEAGRPLIGKVDIKIIGQAALLEANLSFPIAATQDVDCFNRIQSNIWAKFNEILESKGKFLDPHAPEAWMPTETEYELVYKGDFVSLFIAQPMYVILSKAKMAMTKNKNLIAEYLANEVIDDRFFELAEKYQIKLADL